MDQQKEDSPYGAEKLARDWVYALLSANDFVQAAASMINLDTMPLFEEANIVAIRSALHRTSTMCDAFLGVEQLLPHGERQPGKLFLPGLVDIATVYSMAMDKEVSEEDTASWYVSLVDDFGRVVDDEGEIRSVHAADDIISINAVKHREALTTVKRRINFLNDEEEITDLLVVIRADTLVRGLSDMEIAENGTLTSKCMMARVVLDRLCGDIRNKSLIGESELTEEEGNRIKTMGGTTYECCTTVARYVLGYVHEGQPEREEDALFTMDRAFSIAFRLQHLSKVKEKVDPRWQAVKDYWEVKHDDPNAFNKWPTLEGLISPETQPRMSQRGLTPHNFGLRGYYPLKTTKTVDGFTVAPPNNTDVSVSYARKVNLELLTEKGYRTYTVIKDQDGRLKLRSDAFGDWVSRAIQGLTIKGGLGGVGAEYSVQKNFRTDLNEDMAEEQILDLLMSPEAGPKAFNLAVSEIVSRRLSVSQDSACFFAHRFVKKGGMQLYRYMPSNIVTSSDMLTDGKHVYLDVASPRGQKLRLVRKSKRRVHCVITEVSEGNLTRCSIKDRVRIGAAAKFS